MAGALIGKRTNGSGRGRYRPMAEINVTPMVDVMLVLLIIFMVTAPMMTSGVNVDLPKTDAKPLNTDSEPLTVSIQGDGKIYLQDNAIELPDLVTKLNAIAAGDMGRRIFVRGDKGISYGQVMNLMATIAQGGFTKVALLADASGAPSAAPPKPGG
jgi:biopolymer transport protein TolR